jgi:hypothetical protein
VVSSHRKHASPDPPRVTRTAGQPSSWSHPRPAVQIELTASANVQQKQ